MNFNNSVEIELRNLDKAKHEENADYNFYGNFSLEKMMEYFISNKIHCNITLGCISF
jgi:hypothetical protein